MTAYEMADKIAAYNRRAAREQDARQDVPRLDDLRAMGVEL